MTMFKEREAERMSAFDSAMTLFQDELQLETSCKVVEDVQLIEPEIEKLELVFDNSFIKDYQEPVNIDEEAELRELTRLSALLENNSIVVPTTPVTPTTSTTSATVEIEKEEDLSQIIQLKTRLESIEKQVEFEKYKKLQLEREEKILQIRKQETIQSISALENGLKIKNQEANLLQNQVGDKFSLLKDVFLAEILSEIQLQEAKNVKLFDKCAKLASKYSDYRLETSNLQTLVLEKNTEMRKLELLVSELDQSIKKEMEQGEKILKEILNEISKEKLKNESFNQTLKRTVRPAEFNKSNLTRYQVQLHDLRIWMNQTNDFISKEKSECDSILLELSVEINNEQKKRESLLGEIAKNDLILASLKHEIDPMRQEIQLYTGDLSKLDYKIKQLTREIDEFGKSKPLKPIPVVANFIKTAEKENAAAFTLQNWWRRVKVQQPTQISIKLDTQELRTAVRVPNDESDEEFSFDSSSDVLQVTPIAEYQPPRVVQTFKVPETVKLPEIYLPTPTQSPQKVTYSWDIGASLPAIPLATAYKPVRKSSSSALKLPNLP